MELLAPAGSLEGLKAVTAAGADAVYIGGSRFGARAYADNPGEDLLLEGIDYAHLRGVKVYMTVNTLLKERELGGLFDYILPYYECGVDAVLVQDFGVLKFLREHFPDLPLHASTQMTVTGPESAALLKELGVVRLVPARELSLRELDVMRERSGLEIETFIHGALCCGYSGQCLYSSLLGGRSGNRGRCAQPCRLLYLLNNDDFDGRTSIVERRDARHYLSPKDLCGIELIPEMARHGIASLKIEGRMKKPEYAAGVTSVYRKYLDLYYDAPDRYAVEEADRRILYDLYNRSGFTDGYYHRHNGPEMMALVKHELTGEETAARHRLYGEMRAKYIDREMKIGARMRAEVYAGQPLRLECSARGASALMEGPFAETAKSSPLSEERIRSQLGKTGGSDFDAETIGVATDGRSFVPVRALSELRRGGLEALKAAILAPYRRSGAIRESVLSAEAAPSAKTTLSAETQGLPLVTVLAATDEQLKLALRSPFVSGIYVEGSLLMRSKKPVEAAMEFIRKALQAGKEPYIALPYIDRRGSEMAEIKDAAPLLLEAGLKGFLARSFESAAFFINRGMQELIRADAGIYTFNSEAQALLKSLGVTRDTAPVELNKKELLHRDNRNSELIVYGYLPLMVTAQCLKKNSGGCTGDSSVQTLTDRMGMKFPVKCDCVFCYNIVRNSLPLSLLPELDAVREMAFPRIRLSFTDEDAKETAAVLAHAEAALDEVRAAVQGARRGRGPAEPPFRSTKGHFKRGVE